ncbi:MAG TPA: hypothetical protein VFU21_03450 [Kofleriaceae bacterium]|nr:hypothetical protein [Kofleriaceae bacterium]
MYRFGDGTPFPLSENFIETIVGAVDCCVALFELDSEAEARAERERLTRRAADDEIKRLDALKALIETAVTPLLVRKERRPRASQAAAQKIYEAAQQIIRQSRAGVARRRDTVIMEAVPPSADERVLEPLEAFFCAHALPRTEWRLRWSVNDGRATAEVGAQATRELDLAFDVAIPRDSDWAHPMSVSALLRGLAIPSVIELNGRRRSINLDAYAVTEVQVAPGRVAMVLRESTKKASPGLHIVMPHSTDSPPLVVALDKRDQAKTHPFCLDDNGSAGVHALWATIEERIPDLLAARSRLVAARHSGNDVTELSPSVLAEAILLSLAPLLREMRMRSRVPGELILKRDLGGDRREEMFVPRKKLWAKLQTLTARHRQVFEAVGLSDEATSDFVTRIGRRPPPPMPRRAMARGTESAAAAGAGKRDVGAFDSMVTDADSIDRGTDPLDKPLRVRPETNGPTFDPEDAETTAPKSSTMVSGVIDAVRIVRSRAQA